MWERHEFLTDVPTGRFAAPTVWRNTFRHGPERPKPIEMTALPLLLCIISGWRSIVYSIKGKHLVSVLLFFLSCKTLVSFNDPMKKSKCIAWSICPLKLLKNKGWRLHLMVTWCDKKQQSTGTVAATNKEWTCARSPHRLPWAVREINLYALRGYLFFSDWQPQICSTAPINTVPLGADKALHTCSYKRATSARRV